jgi:hypothetical protein
METLRSIECTVERGRVLNAQEETYPVHIQAQWIPFFDEFHVLGRVGYDLESESADFHFTWHPFERILRVHPPYRWVESSEETYRELFVYQAGADQHRSSNAMPYYRYPRTKDGVTLVEILETLFERRGISPRQIVLL